MTHTAHHPRRQPAVAALAALICGALTAAAAAVEIDAPRTAPTCAGAFLTAQARPANPDSTVHLFVFGLPVDYRLLDDHLLICPPARPGTIYLAAVEIAPDGTLTTAQTTIDILTGSPPPAPPPEDPPPDDAPPPPAPPAPPDISTQIRTATAAALALVDPAHRSRAATLAAHAHAVARHIRDGDYPDYTAAVSDLTQRNRDATPPGPAKNAWLPFFRRLQTANRDAAVDTLDELAQSLSGYAAALETATTPQALIRVCGPDGNCTWIPDPRTEPPR